MAHFAMICPPLPSHVAAFEALAEALAFLGHRASFVLPQGAASPSNHPVLHVPSPSLHVAGRSGSLFGVLRTVADSARASEALAAHAPALLRESGIDAVLADQMEPAGGLVARALGVPYLSVAAALPIEREAAVPPPFLDWPFDASADGLKRNRGAERVARLLLSRQRRAIRQSAARLGLAGVRDMQDCLSPLGTLSQTVAGFDFPRRAGGRIHHCGPFRRAQEERGAFRFEPDPSRPLVFCSLGTLQGHRLNIFRFVASACRSLGVRLALAHCGGLTPGETARIDAEIVTDFLPQRAVLAHASVCITHAGLNTALDALQAGVPMLAIPIAFDQPGVAARIVHGGAGIALSRRSVSEERVREALARLLLEPSYQDRARSLGREIAEAGGAARAAALAERLLAGGIAA